MEQRQICIIINHWLQTAGLAVDEFGWVNLDELISALRNQEIESDSDFIERINRFDFITDKVGWEIDRIKNRIRATYGHPFPVVTGITSEKPPPILYHGTTLNNLPLILKQGLLPMTRQFVHLSSDVQLAYSVGNRRGTPLIIEIETRTLREHVFYHTPDDVWLTEAIPAERLSLGTWKRMTDVIEREKIKKQLMEEANLYSIVDDLMGVKFSWKGRKARQALIERVYNNVYAAWQEEDIEHYLFIDDESGRCFDAHLNWGFGDGSEDFQLGNVIYSSIT